MESTASVNEGIDCLVILRSCHSGVKGDNKVSKVVIFGELVVLIDRIIFGIDLTEVHGRGEPRVAAILPILPLLLEGRLGMNVSQYFHSSYTIGTEGYKWGSSLDKVVPTCIENCLEDIDRYWIQHTDDYTMRNKQYKKEDHGGYAINVRAFDIAGALDNPRIMEDGNKSLHTMGLNTTFHEVDGYMDIEVKDDKTPNTDSTEVSTFMTETLPLANEKT